MCLTSLLFTAFLFRITKGADPQWSMLQQSDYDLKLEIAEVVWFNRSYLSAAKMDAVPYNRTQRVLNGSLHTLVNLTKEFRFDVQFYKFMSNEYRYFPITFSINACREYELDSFGVKRMLDSTSNIRPCSLKKGNYYVRNAWPDISKWPPLIPHGRYKIRFNMCEETDLLIEFHAYVEIKAKPWNYKL